MKLKDFISSPEGGIVSQAEWARRVGVTRGYFSQMMQELKTPSVPVAWKIEQTTDGAVRMQDWVDDDGRDNDTGLRGQTTAPLEASTSG